MGSESCRRMNRGQGPSIFSPPLRGALQDRNTTLCASRTHLAAEKKRPAFQKMRMALWFAFAVAAVAAVWFPALGASHLPHRQMMRPGPVIHLRRTAIGEYHMLDERVPVAH